MKTQISLFTMLLVPVLALSQTRDYAPDYQERNYTLTIQPVLLAVPIAVVMYETRLTEPMSVALFGGYGKFTYERAGADVDATAYGAGAQVRFYAFDRHVDPRARYGEPHFGIQTMWAHGEGSPDNEGFGGAFSDNAFGRGEQFMAGPFLGYKYTLGFGLTAEVQAGAQAGARYTYSDASTNTDAAWGFDWLPIANLGVGWSF